MQLKSRCTTQQSRITQSREGALLGSNGAAAREEKGFSQLRLAVKKGLAKGEVEGFRCS